MQTEQIRMQTPADESRNIKLRIQDRSQRHIPIFSRSTVPEAGRHINTGASRSTFSDTRVCRADFVLIAALGILSVILLVIPIVTAAKPDSPALLIRVDGKEYGTYSLDNDQTIQIGDTNVCEIQEGKVKMIKADCPDKICLHQNAIDEDGGTIVCLPNKIVLSIVNANVPEGGELDGVAR